MRIYLEAIEESSNNFNPRWSENASSEAQFNSRKENNARDRSFSLREFFPKWIRWFLSVIDLFHF